MFQQKKQAQTQSSIEKEVEWINNLWKDTQFHLQLKIKSKHYINYISIKLEKESKTKLNYIYTY